MNNAKGEYEEIEVKDIIGKGERDRSKEERWNLNQTRMATKGILEKSQREFILERYRKFGKRRNEGEEED